MSNRVFWLLLLLAAAVRVAFACLPHFSSTTYEEAIAGLMARQILHGDPLLFWWGQPYQGTLEYYFIAAVFWIFGVSVWALRVVPIATSLAGLAAVYFLGRTLFNKKIAGLAALFLAVPPLLLLQFSLIPYSGYLSSIALGAPAMLWTYNLIFRRETLRLPGLHYFGVGFCCGLLVWLHLLNVSYLMASVFLLAVCERRFLLGRGFFILLCGVALGSSPLILWNLSHHWGTFTGMVSGKETSLSWNRLKFIWLDFVPEILGFSTDTFWRKIFFWVFYVPFALFVLAATIRLAWRKWNAASFLCVYFWAAILLQYAFNYNNARYLFPIYCSAPLLIACFWSLWERKARWLAPSVIAVLTGMNLFSALSYSFGEGMRPRWEMAQIQSFLSRQGIDGIYGEGRLVWPIAFESRGKIVSSDMIFATNKPYYMAGVAVNMQPYFREGRTVLTCEKMAMIAHDRFPLFSAAKIERNLRAIGARFKTEKVGQYTVFYDMIPPAFGLRPLEKEKFALRGSVAADRLHNAVDGNLSTSWKTGRAQQKGDFLEIDFPQPVALAKISLLAGENRSQQPSHFIVEVSPDGARWKEAVDLKEEGLGAGFDWVGKNPGAQPNQDLHLYFSGEKVRKARLLLTGPSPDDWGLAELLVCEAEGKAPLEPTSALLEKTAARLREKNVPVAQAPAAWLLLLEKPAPLFDPWLAPFKRSSSRIDFSRPNAFWIRSSEGPQLLRDFSRLQLKPELLFNQEETQLWLVRPPAQAADLPSMIWEEQRLFDYDSRKYPLFDPQIPRGEIFGGQVRLLGVTLPQTKKVRAGEKIEMKCLWECLRPIENRWGIFVHFEGPGGARFQADHRRAEGGAPDGRWRPGEKVADIFDVEIPAKLPDGPYQIWIGWYDARRENGKRLAVLDPVGHKKESRLKIGELVCESETDSR